MTGDIVGGKPYRIEARIDKYDNDELAGDPYETVVVSAWFENGEEVTDPIRISELEKSVAEC